MATLVTDCHGADPEVVHAAVRLPRREDAEATEVEVVGVELRLGGVQRLLGEAGAPGEVLVVAFLVRGRRSLGGRLRRGRGGGGRGAGRGEGGDDAVRLRRALGGDLRGRGLLRCALRRGAARQGDGEGGRRGGENAQRGETAMGMHAM